MILLGKISNFFYKLQMGKIEKNLRSDGLLEQAKELNNELIGIFHDSFDKVLDCVDDVALFNAEKTCAGVESYVIIKVAALRHDYLERSGLAEELQNHFAPQPFAYYMRRYTYRVVGFLMLFLLSACIASGCLFWLFSNLALPVILAGYVLGTFATYGLLKLVFSIYFGTGDILKIRDILLFQSFREYFIDLQQDMLLWLANTGKNRELLA